MPLRCIGYEGAQQFLIERPRIDTHTRDANAAYRPRRQGFPRAINELTSSFGRVILTVDSPCVWKRVNRAPLPMGGIMHPSLARRARGYAQFIANVFHGAEGDDGAVYDNLVVTNT